MKKFIPDCFWPLKDQGDYVSHEAVCVLNTNTTPANISLTVYFEDKEKLGGYSVEVGAERTAHIRLDKLTNAEGQAIPRNTPYALLIESDVDVALQYTRVDTTQAELTIATTMI